MNDKEGFVRLNGDSYLHVKLCRMHENCQHVVTSDGYGKTGLHIQEPQKARILEALNGRRGTADGVSVDLARRVPT